MAITAATTATNRIYRSVNPMHVFESALPVLTSASNWVQGDLIFFDTSAKIINRVSATGNAATIVGIADNSVTSGKVVGPYAGLASAASEAIFDLVGPVHNVDANMILKTGDTFNVGDKVYLADGATTQTVTSTDPGDANYVGYFVGASVASASAGQQGTVRIIARYPALDI